MKRSERQAGEPERRARAPKAGARQESGGGESRRRGPRGRGEDTRAAILAAARRRFAERGYDGATLRDIAAEAGVDVALVSYLFGNKEGVFAAAMSLPVNPGDVVEALLAEGTDDIGQRLIRRFLSVWDDPRSADPLIALVRSAATHEQAAELLRGFVEREILGRLARAIDAPDPDLRVALCGTQLVGLVMGRYVLRIAPVATADAATLAAAVGPTLQRYLTGELRS